MPDNSNSNSSISTDPSPVPSPQSQSSHLTATEKKPTKDLITSTSTSSFINRLITRTTSTAASTFNSPATTTTTTTSNFPFPAPTPPSVTKLRTGFSVERIYEFEAPQFYDFTKQSDPERGHLDEHWFDSRKRTPSSPDFHFIARTSSSSLNRPKSASGKLCHKGNYSGSNGGLSFMNTPIGRGQNFLVPSSVGADIRSSSSFTFNSYPHRHNHHEILKKSENVTGGSSYCFLNSGSSSDPPATILRSSQKRFREFGSDERKIISGFLSTPLLVVKTPGNLRLNAFRNNCKELPRSPLQKVTKKLKSNSNLGLFSSDEFDGTSYLVKETSSFEETETETTQEKIKESENNETILIEETLKEQDHSIFSSNSSLNSTTLKSTGINNNSIVNKPLSTSLNSSSLQREKEHDNFQASVKARIRAEQERIELQAAQQARKLQKLKAGPTNLPTKSTKPLTVPQSFRFGCDGRAQLKKMTLARFNNGNTSQSSTNTQNIIKPQNQSLNTTNSKFSKPSSLAQKKFVPTVPQSPLFASKLKSLSGSVSTIKTKSQASNTLIDTPSTTTTILNTTDSNSTSNVNPINTNNNDENRTSNNNLNNLRRKLEYRSPNVTIPKSPKLSSIHRNRFNK